MLKKHSGALRFVGFLCTVFCVFGVLKGTLYAYPDPLTIEVNKREYVYIPSPHCDQVLIRPADTQTRYLLRWHLIEEERKTQYIHLLFCMQDLSPEELGKQLIWEDAQILVPAILEKCQLIVHFKQLMVPDTLNLKKETKPEKIQIAQSVWQKL